VPVPAYRPLPAALTAPLAEPTAPPARCTWLGISTQCASDALLWIESWRGELQQCNADRATAAKLSVGIAP
jgi:hypothetical protein